MKWLSANYFLNLLFTTVSTMYDTSIDVKIFTFDLAGKCEE